MALNPTGSPPGPAPTLILAWGNPSRGDDGLGPACLATLQERWIQQGLALDTVEFLEDFQLQIEHVCDLLDRKRVLLIDASIKANRPFEVERVQPWADHSVSSHALSPQALLHVMQTVHGPQSVPPVWVLGIAGQSFELGEGLSPDAEQNLNAASQWAWEWLSLATQHNNPERL